MEKVFGEIDSGADRLVERLREAVAIPSVSGDPARRPDVIRMVHWMKQLLETVDVECELRDIGKQKQSDGTELPLPPVLLGVLGRDPAKKTLCVYGHIDVQPAKLSDGWSSEPFTLTPRGDQGEKLYGRGSTDDKGPCLAWVNAVEAYKTAGVQLPINIKFVYEAMEESGSEGLEPLIRELGKNWLKDVDFVCISDSYWLGKEKPCLSYGLRGLSYYFVEVQGTDADLHSGCFGGSVYEPLNDLVWLLSQLSSVDGKILIPGLTKWLHQLPKQNGNYTTTLRLTWSNIGRILVLQS